MDEALDLCRQIKSLYKKTGLLNLYVSFYYEKDTIDTERLKSEIDAIKSIILGIENKLVL